MITAVVVGYLCGWIVTTIGVFLIGQRLTDERQPPPQRLSLSIVAGAVWPVLLIGLVELIAVYVCSNRRPKPVSEMDRDLVST